MLNEPSAASVEFGHRERASRKSQGRSLLVYDLGGGTFDVSLVELDSRTHTVVASEGISTLGGDDSISVPLRGRRVVGDGEPLPTIVAHPPD